MADARYLRTPATRVYGEPESVPVLSARRDDVVVAYRGDLVAGQAIVIDLPADVIAVEFSVENAAADAAALVTYLAGDEGDVGQAGLLDHGFERRVPPGAQLIEPRTVSPGDALGIVATAAVRLVVHAHTGV